ncbi:MAG: D-alanyl-D-alanine carboxypeptidase family protein [Lachnospiraceae bacterium]
MKTFYKKTGVCLLTVMITAFSLQIPIFAADTEEPPNTLYANSAVLMDAKTGRVLFEKEGNTVRPMASTTKIMTCILALEIADSNAVATASERAASMPQVKLGMQKGEQFALKDLYYSLMLESHNDTAVAIAETVSGSVEKFTAAMTKKARELGCAHTTFLTPNGLDATKKAADGTELVHSTTAQDLARILSYSVTRSPKKEEFLKITQTRTYSFQDKSGSHSYSCTNHNAFLDQMEGAISGKTGFTAKAGYCYAGALERDGRVYVVALLACGWPNHKQYKWSDTKKLMEYGLKNYRLGSFSDVEVQTDDLATLQVTDAKSNSLNRMVRVPVMVKKNRDMTSDGTILLRSDEKIGIVIHQKKKLSAPVKKGKSVGTISYIVDGRVYRTEQIQIAKSVEKVDFIWCFRQVQKRFLPE